MYRLQPLLFQAVPSRLCRSLSEIMEEVRAAHFPGLEAEAEVRFASEGALARIYRGFMGDRRHMVVFHPILNHPGTPEEVLRFICKHELTHIVRPPRWIDGELDHHPPEFWDFEYAIAPERFAAWAWIYGNLGGCLRDRKRKLRVTPRWRAIRDSPRTPYTPSLPFNGERWDRICPGDGAQLHLPPDWPPRPLPFGLSRARATRAPVSA